MGRDLVLPKREFLGYKDRFHSQVIANPLKALVEYDTPSDTETSSDFYDRIVGGLPVTTVSKDIHVLFDINATGRDRNKFGIQDNISCVLFTSPQELESNFGFWKFPEKALNVRVLFEGENYLVDTVRYLEEMYGHCISVMLQLKTAKRGG